MMLKQTNKLAKIAFSGALLAFSVSNALATTVVTFDNTGIDAGFAFVNSYTESGLTITATGNTSLGISDRSFFKSNNGTDFGFFSDGTGTVTLSATNLFSLHSFNAENFFESEQGGNVTNVTLNGFQGGTTPVFTQVFQTSNTDWSSFNLTGWNNLSSVSITSQGDRNFLALDNIAFTEVTPVPEPEEWAMMMLGLPLMGFVARRRKSSDSISFQAVAA